MNLGTLLRSLQAMLITAATFVSAYAIDIGTPYNWIATGAIAIALAGVSELVAGYGARVALATMNTVRVISRTGRATPDTVTANNPTIKPWWWNLVQR